MGKGGKREVEGRSEEAEDAFAFDEVSCWAA